MHRAPRLVRSKLHCRHSDNEWSERVEVIFTTVNAGDIDLKEQPQAPPAGPDISRRSAWTLLGRALLLRCPACGGGGLFTGFFRTKERCPNCGLLLERGESDYFLGGYTLNLIAVEGLLAIGFLIVILITWPNPPWAALQYGGIALAILGAVVCYPFAKTTWLALDLMFRPPKREDFIMREK